MSSTMRMHYIVRSTYLQFLYNLRLTYNGLAFECKL